MDAASSSLPAAVPRAGPGGRSRSQDCAIHWHSINKSALLLYEGDKHAVQNATFLCALSAECRSQSWLLSRASIVETPLLQETRWRKVWERGLQCQASCQAQRGTALVWGSSSWAIAQPGCKTLPALKVT